MPPSTPTLFPSTPTSAPITAHCDGGARGNPGPAGYGVEITDERGEVLAELSEFLGIRTNNFAEYSGLLASLDYALTHGHKDLRVISDSELMVKQIQGKYKVNSPDLKPLWQEAKNRIARLDRFEIAHALRHKNKAADRLANRAMDRGMNRGPDPNPRATPYPKPSTAPTPPVTLDPAPKLSSSRPPQAPSLTPQPPSSRPKSSHREHAVERPLYSAPAGPQPTPTMLRGFARDGVIHILGPHTLPNGTFVKIIPE